MGDGGRDMYRIDFAENKSYYESNSAISEHEENRLTNTFTKEEKRKFINSCYTAGLFNLKEKYETSEIICDGGGWKLTVTYKSGEQFRSEGSNAGPALVFKQLRLPFYEIFEDKVFLLPNELKEPPNITVGVKGDLSPFPPEIIPRNPQTHPYATRADYSWNKGRFVSESKDYFTINENKDDTPLFFDNVEYTIHLISSSNYHYAWPFYKFVLKSYDYNEELTGEEILLEKTWFNKVTLPAEINKIYVYEMYYLNGDYVAYTFNTRSLGNIEDYKP